MAVPVIARQRNPRRVMLADLRTLKDHLANIVARWTVHGDVYVECPPGENAATHQYLRIRRPDEYPETQATKWAKTALELRQLADAAERLATMADMMAEKPWPVASVRRTPKVTK